jgi:SpoVK/Ycf46/Vps4 family AAA+-type ATPase
MIYNKGRFALLAGIDDRDQYFGKTLLENSLWEAEDDLDAAEDEEEAPLEAEEAEEDEEGEEESIPREDIIDALAPVLGVDPEELSALVSGDEGGDEEVELDDDEEAEEDSLELESDVVVVDASSEHEYDVHEARLRRAIRGEIRDVISEVMLEKDMKQLTNARRMKSVAAAMGYRPAFTPSRVQADLNFHRSTGLRLGKGFIK